jgi:hypothetical protein
MALFVWILKLTNVTDARSLGVLYQLRLCYFETYYDCERLSGSVTEITLSVLITGHKKVKPGDRKCVRKLTEVCVMSPCALGGNLGHIQTIISHRIEEDTLKLFLRALSATLEAQRMSLNS